MWNDGFCGDRQKTPTTGRSSRAAGESRGDQNNWTRSGGQFLRLARAPYPDRGTSTVRTGAESHEAGGDGGARAPDKSAASVRGVIFRSWKKGRYRRVGICRSGHVPPFDPPPPSPAILLT